MLNIKTITLNIGIRASKWILRILTWWSIVEEKNYELTHCSSKNSSMSLSLYDNNYTVQG